MKFRKILPTIIIVSVLVLIQNRVSAQESQTPGTFGGKITEILEVRTLLGSIGLILAVPLTTFLASLVADSN